MQFTSVFSSFKILLPRRELIIPDFIFRVFKQIDCVLIEIITINISAVATITALVLAFVISTLCLTFLISKVQAEVVSFTVFLGETDWNDKTSSFLGEHSGQILESGKELLQSKILTVLNPDNNPFIEEDLQETWKVFYQSYLTKHATPDVGKSLLGISNFHEFYEMNTEMVSNFLSHVWQLVSSNYQVVAASLQTFTTVIVYGSATLANLIVSFIIFSTSLYYMISMSENDYYPLRFVFNLTTGNSKGKEYVGIVEEAIRSVFGASCKMAAFYGLYTYFTHTLFEVVVRYIPALLAATFAVLPFIGTFWISLPGSLYLIFIKQNILSGIGLFMMHILPTFFVDLTIYSDISQGHPYFTALAVAGGLYCFGISGAIIGPLILCTLLAFVHIYQSILDRKTPRNDLTSQTVIDTQERTNLHAQQVAAATSIVCDSLRKHKRDASRVNTPKSYASTPVAPRRLNLPSKLTIPRHLQTPHNSSNL